MTEPIEDHNDVLLMIKKNISPINTIDSTDSDKSGHTMSDNVDLYAHNEY